MRPSGFEGFLLGHIIRRRLLRPFKQYLGGESDYLVKSILQYFLLSVVADYLYQCPLPVSFCT